ncbi:MAG: RidA family protein [Janthinobacterium lividum]
MPNIIDARLAELGLSLPTPALPVANYVPWVISAGMVVVSGQLPLQDGTVAVTGLLGAGVSVEEGVRGTRLSLLGVLAQLRAACDGDLGRVRRVVRLGGFIAATPAFTQHAQVMNGASDLAVALFAEAGRHARSTVGVASLPLGAAVEVEGLFELA